MPPLPSFLKTRLAPTPSGFLHAGNVVNFLLTAALAKQYGAELLLRIDDLDRERYRRAYAEDVFETLHFLNIQWAQGPSNGDEFEQTWSQQYRMDLYRAALQTLVQKKAVFACTCSRTQSSHCECVNKGLPLDVPDSCWRLRTDDTPISVTAIGGNMETASLPPEMKNFIVRKKDGLPAYQLSSVVDDLHFGIDFIVRGADLWPSTLAQHFLAKQLGEERFGSIAFIHHPLLTGSDGEKLSKSAGVSSIRHWRESGKSLAELLAFIDALSPVGQDAQALKDWLK